MRMLAYSGNYFLFYIYWATAHSEMKQSGIELARLALRKFTFRSVVVFILML